MKFETMIKKNGVIYGVSSRYDFGRWIENFFCFRTEEDAFKWLHTETYCSADRELMSKNKLIKSYGVKALREAEDMTKRYAVEREQIEWGMDFDA